MVQVMAVKGIKCPWHRLTEKEVRAIRADRISKLKDLAERYNVSIATIYGIRTGRTWAHLV
jgi:hypothetical protein